MNRRTDGDRDDPPAGAGPAPGVLAELVEFLRENKRWWLLPLAGILVILGLLLVFSGSGSDPFAYSLF
jgi:hypothetical protein